MYQQTYTMSVALRTAAAVPEVNDIGAHVPHAQ